MSRMQKFAWFNLGVIVLTLLVVFSLLPVIGYRAMGGLGFLGFIGFGPLFFRKSAGQVVADERDLQIQWRSVDFRVRPLLGDLRPGRRRVVGGGLWGRRSRSRPCCA